MEWWVDGSGSLALPSKELAFADHVHTIIVKPISTFTSNSHLLVWTNYSLLSPQWINLGSLYHENNDLEKLMETGDSAHTRILLYIITQHLCWWGLITCLFGVNSVWIAVLSCTCNHFISLASPGPPLPKWFKWSQFRGMLPSFRPEEVLLPHGNLTMECCGFIYIPILDSQWLYRMEQDSEI